MILQFIGWWCELGWRLIGTHQDEARMSFEGKSGVGMNRSLMLWSRLKVASTSCFGGPPAHARMKPGWTCTPRPRVGWRALSSWSPGQKSKPNSVHGIYFCVFFVILPKNANHPNFILVAFEHRVIYCNTRMIHPIILVTSLAYISLYPVIYKYIVSSPKWPNCQTKSVWKHFQI